ANVIIFCFDGECSTPRGQLKQIYKYNSDRVYINYTKYLKLYIPNTN
ncbi:22198_t:CDS:1, partial [Gigaspora margarita]